MNERVKELRKALKLSQAEFAERINLSRNFIYMIESGINGMSDRTFSDICREYNVNPAWLRDGEGEMFLTLSKEEELANLFGLVVGDSSELAKKKKSLILTLLRLDEKSMEILADVAESWVENMEK